MSAVMAVDHREKWRAALGALTGLLLTGLITHFLGTSLGSGHWLVAPVGASAVILFAMPSSPVAQPWPVIGGSTLSALTGIVMSNLVPDLPMAAALAVGAALMVMLLTRSLHPPGGALAVLAVLEHVTELQFVVLPVLINTIMLVAVAAFYNTRTGRPYPQSATAPSPSNLPVSTRFTAADLDAALAQYNQILDINRSDLETLLHDAESRAFQRTLGELRCRDIMSRNIITIHGSQSLAHACQLFEQHPIKALPVVDRQGRIEGILTRADVIKRLNVLKHLTQTGTSGLPAADLERPVRDFMSRQVRVASDTLHVMDLLPLFSQGGHHHLPVLDDQQSLVGMITQSDVVRALHRAIATPLPSTT